MKFRPLLRIVSALAAAFFFSLALWAQEQKHVNPLVDMVGKPYAEYIDVWTELSDSLFFGTPAQRAEFVGLFKEPADIDASGEWELNRRMITINADFFESRDGGLIVSGEYTAEDYVDDMLTLATDAGKKHFRLVRLCGLFYAAEGCRIFIQDYERAFALYLEIAAELENIPTQEFPMRPRIYKELADLYFSFREYGEAIVYYRKIAEDPDMNDNFSYYSALNGLGLCYRAGEKDYERSDSCFMRILDWVKGEKQFRQLWENVTRANIGYNHYLRGDLDSALVWLLPAVEKIEGVSDYPFLSSKLGVIADIYLKKNRPQDAQKYIDRAVHYRNESWTPKKPSGLYEILARYYAFTGDKQKANAYMDSTLMVKEQEYEEFSGLVLKRVEQRIHQQELNQEKIRSRYYLRTAYIVSGALVVIFCLFALTFVFYRRTRRANRELVRQSLRWAGIDITQSPDYLDGNGEKREEILPTEEQKVAESTVTADISTSEVGAKMMEDIDAIIRNRELYKRPDLSLNILAAETNYSRNLISDALNRCAKKNFYTYINEYRIKEAIRIMSEDASNSLTIDVIALDSGFNDRHGFLRVFKKATGLSPSEFRKNKKISTE